MTIEQTPSDYTDPPKPGQVIRNGFSASADSDRMGDLWVTGSTLSHVFTQHMKNGYSKESTVTGNSTPSTAFLSQSRREWFGTQLPTVDCSSVYRSSNTWRMERQSATGNCFTLQFKWYPSALEMSSYNDTSTWNPDFIQSERLVHTARTSCMMFVGNYGITNVCQVRITYTWSKMVSRYETEVSFEGMSSPPVATVASYQPRPAANSAKTPRATISRGPSSASGCSASMKR